MHETTDEQMCVKGEALPYVVKTTLTRSNLHTHWPKSQRTSDQGASKSLSRTT